MLSSTIAGLAMVLSVGLGDRPAWAVTLNDFKRFTVIRPTSMPTGAVLLSPPLDAGADWDELVVSYDVEPGPNRKVDVQVRLLPEGSATTFYRLGSWTPDFMPFGTLDGNRTSVNGQDDEWARVDTDTLTAKKAGRQFELMITCDDGGLGPKGNPEQQLKSITVSFLKKGNGWTAPEPNTAAWGKTLEPPKRAQAMYENGGVICSPTATSMLLGYWAQKMGDPSIDKDVPTTVQGVYDPAWKGTGNWIFNTAFAASQPGLTGSVVRLNDLRDLEDLIAADIPVACSVSYGLLKGKGAVEPNDGHIVVLVGFTKEGDPIFNDPGRNVVRMTYKREDFSKAWANSGRTIYLIHPEKTVRPKLSID